MSIRDSIIDDTIVIDTIISENIILDDIINLEYPLREKSAAPLVKDSEISMTDPAVIRVIWDREMLSATGIGRQLQLMVDGVAITEKPVVTFDSAKPNVMYLTMPKDFLAGEVITWEFKSPVLTDLTHTAVDTSVHPVRNTLLMPVTHLGIPVTHLGSLVYHTP